MKTIFLTLLISLTLCHVEAATTSAQYTLPSNANSWFYTITGMGTDDGIVYDNRRGQIFTPTTSGYLESIGFHAFRRPSATADLQVALTTVTDGQPDITLETMHLPSSAIGMTELSLNTLKSGAFSYSVTSSGTVFLTEGVTYALLFYTETTEAGYRIYGGGTPVTTKAIS